MPLREDIEQLAAREAGEYTAEECRLFAEFKTGLNRGEIRAAERNAEGAWQTNAWVKRGILLGFRVWRPLRDLTGGVVVGDLNGRSLVFRAEERPPA